MILDDRIRRAREHSIPWRRSECRELKVRGIAAHQLTAIVADALPRDSRRPGIIVLQRDAVRRDIMQPCRGLDVA